MGKMIIRKSDKSDKNPVISLWADIFNSKDFHNKPEIAFDMKIKHSNDLLFVAEENKNIVGTVLVGYDGHRGWIYSLAVHPNFRKIGIGTQLMNKAINELKSLGCLKVNLQIMDGNSDVINFYKKLGFNIEDRVSMGMKIY